MRTFARLLIIAPLFFALAACMQQRPAIRGHIEGLGNDSLLVIIGPLNPEIEYTFTSKDASRFWIYSKDGKFKLDTIGKHPAYLEIRLRSLAEDGTNDMRRNNARIIRSYLKPGEHAVVKGRIDDNKTLDYLITGTAVNEDLSHLRRQTLPLAIKIDSLDMLIGGGNRSFDLITQRRKSYEQNVNYYYEYIKNNPDAESAGIVATYIPYDSLDVYYAKLGNKARTSVLAKQKLSYLLDLAETSRKYNEEKDAALKHIIPGADAPRFTLKSTDGGEFSLTDVNDKYIVLDFWGSWCGFCMRGMPAMKEYYAKYKDKVEFIGISCNDSEKKWLETVAKENLPWINLIEDPKDRTSGQYAIEGFPSKIIIGKDYKIVARFAGESYDFYTKLDELFEN